MHLPFTHPTMETRDQSELNAAYNALALKEGLLPIKVAPFYQKKIEEEVQGLGHRGGPLHRSVYPTEERMTVRAPGEVSDFVDDRENMPKGLRDTAVKKYRNRVLFFPTDTCIGHCQYCFRQDVLTELHGHDSEIPAGNGKVDKLIAYLAEHPEVKEVILSGGDPMTLPFSRLEDTLQRLRTDAGIRNIRIHTRSLVYSPAIFKPEMIRLLAEAGVRLVMHSVHPYELCEEVEDYIRQLRSAGVRLYNQFPVLRKVNDHPKVLERHLEKLDGLGVRNLSIFIPDPIKYSASFRIRLKRLFSIMDTLNWSTSSWVNSTRIVLDTHYGKVRREDLKSYNEQSGIAIFEREGHQIPYPDFPEALDEPGELSTLLWKDHRRQSADKSSSHPTTTAHG